MKLFSLKRLWYLPAVLLPYFLSSQFALAAEEVGGVAKALMAPAVAIVVAALWVLQAFLGGLLKIVAAVLDFVFQANVNLVPGADPVVMYAWGLIRDIVNGFFILILVWIAITIILGMERLGGKQLLFRVIAVALLINFSLVFVSLVFGVSNVFALAFYRQLPTCNAAGTTTGTRPEDRCTPNQSLVGEHIINALQNRTTVVDIFSESPTSPPTPGPIPPDFTFRDLPSQFATALGVKQAQAIIWIPILLGALKGAAWLVGLTLVGKGLIEGFNIYAIAVNLAFADLYLLITIAAITIMDIMLIVRIVAHYILSVLAPLAMGMFILPGGFGETIWKKWLNALFRWAFFAPAFFFLFYLSLLVLQASRTGPAEAAHRETAFVFINLLAAAMMIASVVVARKIAGSGADMALGAFSKLGTLGLGLATGGLGFAAGIATRRFAPQLEKGLAAVSERPVIGKITAPITRRADKYIAEQRGTAEEEKKKRVGLSPDALGREINRSLDARIIMGSALALKEQGKFHTLNQQQLTKVMGVAPQFAKEKDVVESAPHLITNANASRLVKGTTNRREAIQKIVREAEDRTKFTGASFDDPEVKRAFLATVRGGDELGRLARNNAEAYKKLVDHYDSSQADMAAAFREEDTRAPGTGTRAQTIFDKFRHGHLMGSGRRRRRAAASPPTARPAATYTP